MTNGPLVKVNPDANQSYIDNFLRTIRESPRITISNIASLKPEKPIIGQVLEKCFDYTTILSLRRFEDLKGPEYDGAWASFRGICGNYCLCIGQRDGCLEIFQRDNGKTVIEYFFTSKSSQLKDVAWIRPPKTFLKDTLELLPTSYQLSFKELVLA